jgi:anti-sigma factor RsiW
MSGVQAHLEDGQLLRYLDGELPSRQTRRVRGHIEACWECRAAVEELEGAIADCVQYRKQVLQAHLPPPPDPWADLSAGFARIDSEVGAGSWWARLGDWLAAPAARRWAMTAAGALVLAAGLYYRFHETPSVQASALLKRAVAVAATRPAPARQIRIRTSVRNRAVIPAMFREAKYSADNPLSAKSYQDWRAGLRAKTDEVATKPDPQTPGQQRYEIRTTAAAGDLAMARLTLRATDLRPVEGRFEFRNREWVEYEEISDASTTDGGTPADTRLEGPMRQTVPSRSAALPSGSSASISEELRVVAALHEIGADLGDPVEVNLVDGRVIVSGVGVTAERQREIRRALEDIPYVVVRFSEPTLAGAAAADAGLDTDPAGRNAGMQSRLEQQLGGRAEFERVSGHLLEVADSAMARVYALRSLSQRFHGGAVMSGADATRLNDLARNHLAVLTTHVNDLHRTLAPVLVSLGGKTAQGRPATSGSWQAAVEDLFRISRRMEQLLSSLLGATPDAAPGHVPTELLGSLADMKVEIEALSAMMQ